MHSCIRKLGVFKRSMTTVSPKPTNLLEYGERVLKSTDMTVKCELTREAFKLFNNNDLPIGNQENPPSINDRPGRPDSVVLSMFDRQFGKIKNDQNANKIKLIHSQAHIESYAIDIHWDTLVRFSGLRCADGSFLPRQFFTDFLRVCFDESVHYIMWADRLEELGSQYGALPIHNGLWESCIDTKDDFLARLAILNLVHESHGLDTTTRLINQFNGNGDRESAAILFQIQDEEISHVYAGVKWFTHVTEIAKEDTISTFHQLVRKHFKGFIRPPFNHELRLKAGMTPEWYEPLASERPTKTVKTDVADVMARRKEKKKQKEKENVENQETE